MSVSCVGSAYRFQQVRPNLTDQILENSTIYVQTRGLSVNVGILASLGTGICKLHVYVWVQVWVPRSMLGKFKRG